MPETVQKYSLCATCLGRQGGGRAELEAVDDRSCFICGGLMAQAPSIAEKVAAAARSYEFRTFSVGISMPTGVLEREDEVRSALRLKGRETVKVQLSAAVAKLAAEKLRRRLERGYPELTAVVDVSGGSVRVLSRPLFVYGRYAKPAGVSQKREWCKSCRGEGCDRCRGTGFERRPSVEGLVLKGLAGCGAESAKFTWIGSEDRDSSVLPPGRPFVVELKNPVTRGIPRTFGFKTRRGVVQVSRLRRLPSKPVGLPSFKFRTLIVATVRGKPDEDSLSELRKRFRDAQVKFDRPHDRPVVKIVHRVAAKAAGRKLTIDAWLDGGLPVKRFVSGELVYPSVSEVLKKEARCVNFDILKVTETGDLQFAKITRVQT